MMKFGVVVAAAEAEALRLHLASHLRFTEMRDIAFVIVPRVGGEAASAVDGVVREFRAWAPVELAGDIGVLAPPAVRFLGNCLHAGAEAAARTHGCEVLVFASEATVVGPGWRGIMEEGIESARAITHDRVGLLGARSTGLEGPQSVFHPALFDAGVTRKDWQEAMRNGRMEPDLRGNDARPSEDAPASVEFAWPRISTLFAAIPAASYFDAGGFDQDLPADRAADDTLSIRLLRKGYHNFVSRCFVPNLGNGAIPGGAGGGPGNGERRSVREDLRRGMKWFREHYPDSGEVVRRELQWTGILS